MDQPSTAPRPRPPAPALVASVALVAFLLSLASCGVPVQTYKPQSLVPWQSTVIHGLPASDYLRARWAILVSGADGVEVLPSGDTIKIAQTQFGKPTDSVGGGAAVHVGEGFWLTAAHCVRSAPNFLVRLEPDRSSRVWPVQVVWRGGDDLALLHGTAPGPEIPPIELCDTIPASGPVLSLGSGLNSSAWAGGHITGCGGRTDTSDFGIIHHDAPVSQGDSGGPVMLIDGRLAGINSTSILRVRDGKGDATAGWLSAAELARLKKLYAPGAPLTSPPPPGSPAGGSDPPSSSAAPAGRSQTPPEAR